MRKIDLKILNSVSEFYVKLSTYASELVDEALNEDLLDGSNNDELIENIIHLVNEKLLTLKDKCLNFHEIISISDFHKESYLGLTSKGGSIWENEYNVNWENFWDYYTDVSKEVYTVHFKSTNHEFIKTVFEYVRLISEVISLYDITLDQNCKVFYWKELENVYQFSFDILPDNLQKFELDFPNLIWKKPI